MIASTPITGSDMINESILKAAEIITAKIPNPIKNIRNVAIIEVTSPKSR